jgi:hypothetical protein
MPKQKLKLHFSTDGPWKRVYVDFGDGRGLWFKVAETGQVEMVSNGAKMEKTLETDHALCARVLE